MEPFAAALARRVREVRENAGVSRDAARHAIEVSRSTCSDIESGERPLKGDELVVLADLFGARTAAISGYAHIREHARYVTCPDRPSPSMDRMRDHLYACLELDGYLASQGIG